MTYTVEIIIIIILGFSCCFIVYAECSELCDCGPSNDIPSELQISSVSSPIQDDTIEV